MSGSQSEFPTYLWRIEMIYASLCILSSSFSMFKTIFTSDSSDLYQLRLKVHVSTEDRNYPPQADQIQRRTQISASLGSAANLRSIFFRYICTLKHM